MSGPLPDLAGITDVRRFGRYYLLRKLAEGGMAEIYLAKIAGAEGFERDVVIKLMLDHLRHSADLTRMFFTEARVAARLVHPHIVQIIDLGEADQRHFMCMEYLPGEDLHAIIGKSRERQMPIPVELAAKIISAACDGLDFAHEFQDEDVPLNIVHRDVSPSNILVTYQGAVKLLDFGVAKVASQMAKTDAGRVKGKWLYMSPEQARNDDVDRRSDVFSLGLTFHELLTLRPVFKRDKEIAIVKAVLEDPIPSPKAVRPDLPDAVVAVVMKALEREPSRRYPTAAAMRTDLERFLQTTNAASLSLGQFLQNLFGREAMENKTQVPSLDKLRARGLIAPTPAQAPSGRPFERPLGVSAALPTTHTPATAIADGMATSDAARAIPIPPIAHRGFPWAALTAGLALVAAASAWIVALQRKPAEMAPPLPVVANPVPPVPTTTPVSPIQPKEPPQPVALVQPPRPKPAAPVQLTERIIGAVVARSSEEILSCFERHRSDLPSSQGEVNLTLTIVQAGAVKEVRVATPGFESSALSECVTRQVKALKFPRHTDKEVTITLPFKYRVKG